MLMNMQNNFNSTVNDAQKHYYRDQKEKLEDSTVKCVEIIPFFYFEVGTAMGFTFLINQSL